MHLTAFFDTMRPLINQHLDQILPDPEGPFKELFSAARYSVLGNGKRIRPLLALAICHSLNGDAKSFLEPACVLELIHTYSIIHDDLPCMDNDDFRRGKPTLHKAFPEAIALLAGDLLLTFSFELLANAKNLTEEQKIRLITVLSQRSGAHGMIGGQVMDIEKTSQSIDVDTLQQIHQLKTGALITASIEFGAILGHATPAQMNTLQQFGHEIGLAFQIVDDIQDISQSESKHGKKISSDLINNKTTYANLMGIEESRRLAQALLESAIEKLQSLSIDTTLAVDLARFIVNR